MFLRGNGEWVMFEADFWNGDSLSRAIFFSSGTALIRESSRTASQHQCPRERSSLCFSKVSPSCVRWLYTFVMAGGEKSIGKVLLQVGFLSYLDSRTNQTQAVLLEKSGPSITSRHGELLVGHRQVTG